MQDLLAEVRVRQSTIRELNEELAGRDRRIAVLLERVQQCAPQDSNHPIIDPVIGDLHSPVHLTLIGSPRVNVAIRAIQALFPTLELVDVDLPQGGLWVICTIGYDGDRRKLAIFKRTGAIHRMDPDGAVQDLPILSWHQGSTRLLGDAV